jgi:hypothetical protein
MLALMRLNESGQIAELIARFDVDPVREVALLHALGADEQLVDGRRNRLRQRAADDERSALHDQEQHAEQDEHREKEFQPPSGRSIWADAMRPYN